jgi:hypothetical protein
VPQYLLVFNIILPLTLNIPKLLFQTSQLNFRKHFSFLTSLVRCLTHTFLLVLMTPYLVKNAYHRVYYYAVLSNLSIFSCIALSFCLASQTVFCFCERPNNVSCVVSVLSSSHLAQRRNISADYAFRLNRMSCLEQTTFGKGRSSVSNQFSRKAIQLPSI